MKKKLLLGVVVLGLLSFTGDVNMKEFNIRLTGNQINLLGSTLSKSRQSILASTRPTNESMDLLKNIDSLEKIIGAQVQIQLKDTAKIDSVKKVIPVTKKKK